MTNKIFNKLWNDALEQPSMEWFVAEYGYPEWFSEISDDTDEIIKILESIHAATHMPFEEIIAKSGMSRMDFYERFCLKKSTVDKWESGEESCPDYYRLLLCRELGILEVK